jgi:hypothetical protein
MSLLDDLVRRCSRALSAPGRTDLARALLIADAALGLANPVYAAFAQRRHTGEWAPRFGLSGWVQGWRYLAARMCSPKSALFTIDFGSPAHASASAKERRDWATPGSCMACPTKPCCKMKSPWGTLEACPFLRAEGCSIYGGLAWRVGPCGRYPESPARIAEYGCPRFESERARPVVGRPLETVEVAPRATERRVRLRVVPGRAAAP